MGSTDSYALLMPVPAPLPIVSIKLGYNDNIIPLALCAVADHSLEIGAHIVRSRHGAVDVGIHDKNIVVFGVLLAYPKLTFD